MANLWRQFAGLLVYHSLFAAISFNFLIVVNCLFVHRTLNAKRYIMYNKSWYFQMRRMNDTKWNETNFNGIK